MQKKPNNNSRYVVNYFIDQYPYIIVMIQVYNRRYFAGKSKIVKIISLLLLNWILWLQSSILYIRYPIQSSNLGQDGVYCQILFCFVYLLICVTGLGKISYNLFNYIA